MFNLLAIRSAAIPRLERLIASSDTPSSVIPQLQENLLQEQEKLHRMKLENGLRRSNLVGMILECLKQMSKEKTQGDAAGAGKSRLEEAVEKARVIGKEKREKRMKGMDVD
jgi:ubiquitin carboxyl-terminal hydrolase L5